ncbi:MAG: FKBP-type peptidyl-prolyl cis-trans isomerase [Nitrospira sp.]|nr:FKBP-type peptidyl-prolyl cis-trans isomerase [bacterium]MBL7048128.1 FKBP-type peptidyl-prolyl cis-trans isomerase [Nitrospira sp.]
MNRSVCSNDFVKIHFSAFLDDGTIAETTTNADPRVVKLGIGELVPGLEDALVGMLAGEAKTVFVDVDKAYGAYSNKFIIESDILSLSVQDPEVGNEVNIELDFGEIRKALVIEVKDGKVRVDANHPLAGRYIIYEVKVIEIL